MIRVSILALGLILLFTSALTTRWVETLSSNELAASYGGDPAEGVSSINCDDQVGATTSCQAAGDICQYCITQDAFGNNVRAEADQLDPNGFKGNNNVGWMTGDKPQNCGNIFNGRCFVDATQAGGFRCDIVDTKMGCTTSINNIIPQNGGITQNGGVAIIGNPQIVGKPQQFQ